MRQTIVYGFLALFACVLFAAPQMDAQARPVRFKYKTFRIVAFGDNFTAGYGIEPDDAWPTVLRTRLNKEFPRDRIEVVNAGVNGDTADTGVSRLASILNEKPDIVIVAFGHTDALKGLDPNITYKALDQMLSVLTHNNVYVLLTGFEAPKKANIEYAMRYNSNFPTLAKRYNVVYYRDMLKGVADEPFLLQFDEIHPNEEGHQQIAANLYPALDTMIRKLRQRLY